MPDITDARQVTMHYKRKGDRVDEVLHDVVLNHVNRLEQENKRLREQQSQMMADYQNDLEVLEESRKSEKRLREALEKAQSEIIPIRGYERGDVNSITSVCIKIQKALEGNEWE